MRHVSAVAQLDAGGGAFGVDGVGQLAEAGDYLGAHPELAVEGEAAAGDGCVGYGGHAHAAGGDGAVVVEELLRGLVAGAHALEGGRADGAVAQGQRAEGDGGE